VIEQHESFELDDDFDRLDHEVIWAYLSQEAKWGRWRSRETVEAQLRNAWCVAGAYLESGQQVAFARAISDGYGVAYLADVFVLTTHQRLGIGSRLVVFVLNHGPSFRWMLHTYDAHDFYRQLGFREAEATYLERRPSN